MLEKLHVNDFFLSRCSFANKRLLNIILLNSSTLSLSLVRYLFPLCNYKICADGAANRLYNLINNNNNISNHNNELNYLYPTHITGDLDSLDNSIARYYYSEFKTEIIRDPDQDTNDFHKSLNLLDKLYNTKSEDTSHSDNDSSNGKIEEHPTVLVLGARGGRLDQEMASLNALFHWKKQSHWSFKRMILLDEEGCTFLLEPGFRHRIRCIRNSIITEGSTCGLIPVGNKVDSVTTQGLVWNLNKSPLEMGVLVSSSNSIIDNCAKNSGDTTDNNHDGQDYISNEIYGDVVIETSDHLLWTCESKLLL